MDLHQTKSRFCQSCGVSLKNPEDLGTNADGTTNSDNCHLCLRNGELTEPNITKQALEMLTQMRGMICRQ